MKTTLILTDFSENATNAADFGYQFVKQLHGNIILCNAFAVPVVVPESTMVAWPVDEYNEIAASCADNIKELMEKLEASNEKGFKPAVLCVNEVGELHNVVEEVTAKHEIGLIVIGTHGAGGLSSFLLGNHTRRMIDATTKTLLIVPPSIHDVHIKKIAFATDLENIPDDLEAIIELISYARKLNAEILLTYVDDNRYHNTEFKKHMEEMLTMISNWADYPLIYYRLIENHTAESGLAWLCKNGQVDMLAMVHRKRNFLDGALNGSHTQKVARYLTKPLLVFHAKE